LKPVILTTESENPTSSQPSKMPATNRPSRRPTSIPETTADAIMQPTLNPTVRNTESPLITTSSSQQPSRIPVRTYQPTLRPTSHPAATSSEPLMMESENLTSSEEPLSSITVVNWPTLIPTISTLETTADPTTIQPAIWKPVAPTEASRQATSSQQPSMPTTTRQSTLARPSNPTTAEPTVKSILLNAPLTSSLLLASRQQQPSRMPAVTNQPSKLRLSPMSNPTTADPTTIQPTSLKPEESASTESESERTSSQQPSLMPVTATKSQEIADNVSTSANILNHVNNNVAGDLVVNHALDSTAADNSAPKNKNYYLWCLAFGVGLVLVVSLRVFYTRRHQMIRQLGDDKVSTSIQLKW